MYHGLLWIKHWSEKIPYNKIWFNFRNGTSDKVVAATSNRTSDKPQTTVEQILLLQRSELRGVGSKKVFHNTDLDNDVRMVNT